MFEMERNIKMHSVELSFYFFLIYLFIYFQKKNAIRRNDGGKEKYLKKYQPGSQRIKSSVLGLKEEKEKKVYQGYHDKTADIKINIIHISINCRLFLFFFGN